MNILKNYYKKKFKKYGPSMKGVGWSKKSKSKKRYKTLLKVLEFNDNKKKNFNIRCRMWLWRIN